MPVAPTRAATASKLTRAFDRARGRGHQQLQDCDDEALQTNPTLDSQWSSQGRTAAPDVSPGSWAQHRSGASDSSHPGMAVGASSSRPVTPAAPAGSASSHLAPEPASAGGKLSRAFGRIRGGDGRQQLLRQQQDSGSSQVSDDLSSFGSKFGGSAAAANPVRKSDVVASIAPAAPAPNPPLDMCFGLYAETSPGGSMPRTVERDRSNGEQQVLDPEAQQVVPSGHGEAWGTTVQGTSTTPPPWLLKSHLRSARDAVSNFGWRGEEKSRML